MKIDFKRKDIKLKIASLIIAIFVWFYIMGDLGYKDVLFYGLRDKGERAIKDIPVFVMQDAGKLRGNVKIDPKTIDVTIEGRKKDIETIARDDILAYVDKTL